MEHDKLARKQGKTYVSYSGADVEAAKKAVQVSMRKGTVKFYLRRVKLNPLLG